MKYKIWFNNKINFSKTAKFFQKVYSQDPQVVVKIQRLVEQGGTGELFQQPKHIKHLVILLNFVQIIIKTA